MYKEIGFDPECMSDIEYYNLLKQHFGFEKGRYISAEIRPWVQEAMACVKDSELKPVRKQSVKAFLNKISHSKSSDEFLLTTDRKGVDTECWRDWIEEQSKIREFSCIVSEGVGGDSINIDSINEECGVWDVPASQPLERSDPKGIVAGLFPLLVLSEHVVVIDQFFRLTGNRVLVELFRFLSTTSVRSLRIVTSMETPGADRIYEREYRALNASGIHFEWIKAPDKYFHDRYVITEFGALRSGQGFMAEVKKGIHADIANINIIGREESLRTLKELEQLVEDEIASVVLKV